MRLTLKEFQSETVAALKRQFRAAQGLAISSRVSVLLNAPTGSGKTLMVTALIDQLLAGSEDDGADGDPELVFVWLTDQPELNKQTYDKMLATSSVLGSAELVIIDSALDVERLQPGKVYFLNTQKLGGGTSYVRQGDKRTFTLWDTLANSVADAPTSFVLIIDEAHRGARGKDVLEAETIMQKFMKGNGDITAVPLVLGISATPDRFVKLCNDTKRPLLRVDVEPEAVRASGLLKEFVDLYHPDETQPSDVTMLRQAIAAWKRYTVEWQAYGKSQNEEMPAPVLLVQVADAKRGSSSYSTTDLLSVIDNLSKEIPHEEADNRWIAHAFQDDSHIAVGSHVVRHVAPSDIDHDPKVRVVLFKTSLNTGWDCPRAETMVSFRSAKDETNIAQLVGRMVRAPLARRVDSNDHLNTVALFLPYYDSETVQRVVDRLTTDADAVPPTLVRSGTNTSSLMRAPKCTACFEALGKLPTYTIPRARAMKPVARLAKLAGLFADLSLTENPVKDYRAHLVKVLLGERNRLIKDPQFKQRVDEAAVLDIRRRRVKYATANGEDEGESLALRAEIADENVDDLYRESGRLLGEGLHREYLRERIGSDGIDPRQAKLELHALTSFADVLTKLDKAADGMRKSWMDAHKAALRDTDEKYRQIFREILGAGSEPELTTIDPPLIIEGTRSGPVWKKHIYVDDTGVFHESFKSSWERRALEKEIGRADVVGWLRNLDRKPWSLCVRRQSGTKWVGIYPDFLVFRKTKSGVIVDIVDPHLLGDEFAPSRAAALAKYAFDHAESFGRIELVIYQNDADTEGKRLNLVDEEVRTRVASVTTHEHLRQLFEG